MILVDRLAPGCTGLASCRAWQHFQRAAARAGQQQAHQRVAQGQVAAGPVFCRLLDFGQQRCPPIEQPQ